MTRADIEEMLRNLAETTRHLRETSRLTREAAEHIWTVADELTRLEATHLDAVGTTGGKATVATAVPKGRLATSGQLRAWLKASRRTQTSLAKELGLSMAYVSMLIRERRTPSLQIAKRLQTVTGIPATEFISSNGDARERK